MASKGKAGLVLAQKLRSDRICVWRITQY